jgi:hypothetical protein
MYGTGRVSRYGCSIRPNGDRHYGASSYGYSYHSAESYSTRPNASTYPYG